MMKLTVENTHHRLNVQKMKGQRLLITKYISLGKLIEERVGNLAGSSSYNNTNRFSLFTKFKNNDSSTMNNNF